MSPILLFSFVIGYFLVLLGVAWFTSRGSTNESFFIGNRNSKWWMVAFGMIGTSLSGVTFVSVPGGVGSTAFAYFQVVLGYLMGYAVIAFVLLPLYYKMNLTSIYDYLGSRLGFYSYKTGAGFFILSRTLGATARLYLVVKILQDAILINFNIPFWLTTLIILLMILLYTYEGGVKTIVWTDMLQTAGMILGLFVCVYFILDTLGMDFSQGLQEIQKRNYTNVFVYDPNSKLFFIKQLIAGAFIAITMTGMDQEMMQKNISVKTLKDSQKNILMFSVIMVLVNLLFLFLGGMLYLYADLNGIKETGDKLFPAIALQHFPPFISVIFIIALISALFPSADGAITALTASFCIDILGIQRNKSLDDAQRKTIRQRIHIIFVFVFLAFVMVFYKENNPSMIGVILKVAGYTYGPLLGLFSFGILTRRSLKDQFVPFISILAPIICYILDLNQGIWFKGFQIGLELLVLNGFITFLGLYLISSSEKQLGN